jgi:uncharacterized protein (DUF1684 family)
MSDAMPLNAAEYAQTIAEQRAEKDGFFRAHPGSPIPASERQAGFAGLRYYPPDLAYRVVAEVAPFEWPQTEPLGSTGGDMREQLRYAELRFTVAGQVCRLVAYRDLNGSESHELFVPFRDATSGHETYGAGRYLEVVEEASSDGKRTAVLDFNLAYSPWCAYSDNYSCTLPPTENWLSVPISAGERTYRDEH